MNNKLDLLNGINKDMDIFNNGVGRYQAALKAGSEEWILVSGILARVREGGLLRVYKDGVK